MPAHPSYPNDSILEALCELRFERVSDALWSKAPAELVRKLSDKLPDMEPVTETGLELLIDKKTGQPVQRVVQGGVKLRFSNEDKSRLVQVSQDLFSFNVINNYPDWKEMHDSIIVYWETVSKILYVNRVSRIGLRYINVVPFNKGTQKISDWLKPSDYIPPIIKESNHGFSYRIETHPAKDITNIVQIAIRDKQDDKSELVFDIDSILIPKFEHNLSNEITTLHNDNIWEIFKSAIASSYEKYLNTKPDK